MRGADAVDRPVFQAALRSRLPERFGWLEAAFLVVFAGALGMRLWELGGRTMHYDEAIHLHFAWQLLNSGGGYLGWPWVFGTDYLHSPWMHGPFQVELTAFIFRILGDTEFTARLGYALFGAGLVALPYFFRDHLGRYGALLAAVMLALSPTLLYFSRFGRNDIIMVFLAVALLILVWRYIHEGRRAYLYISSAILAVMFASKETAYLLVAIFGLMLLILSLPDLIPWVLDRLKGNRIGPNRMGSNFNLESGPVVPLVLLATLTLPQWMAGFGLVQGALGLTLTNPDPQTGQNVTNPDGSQGIIGAPAWEGSTLLLPVTDASWIIHTVFVVVSVTVLLWIVGRGQIGRRTLALIAAPLLATAAAALLLFRPFPQFPSVGAPVGELAAAALCLAVAVAVLAEVRYPWRRSALLLLVPALIASVYAVLFTPLVNVQAVVDGILPPAASVTVAANGLPTNYVVAVVLLGGSLLLSAILGVRWLGGLWLVCAGVFYVIWAALYTTLFTNMAGLFSGSWQGMGYWIAQQDVARGNQPWYYYFVGLSVYELLPLLFGVAAAIHFIRRGDALGLALTLWAGISLLGYTIASEKMPWLLVNMTVPLVLLSAKYLGELLEGIYWREAFRRGSVILLLVAPLVVVIAVYLVFTYVGEDRGFGAAQWDHLRRRLDASGGRRPGIEGCTCRPGDAAGFAWTGHPASGVSEPGLRSGPVTPTMTPTGRYWSMPKAHPTCLSPTDTLAEEVFPAQTLIDEALVDYDLWYPFVWYVRHHDRNGELGFACFKEREDHDWNATCISPVERVADPGGRGPVPVHGEVDQHRFRRPRTGGIPGGRSFPQHAVVSRVLPAAGRESPRGRVRRGNREGLPVLQRGPDQPEFLGHRLGIHAVPRPARPVVYRRLLRLPALTRRRFAPLAGDRRLY